MQIILLNSCSVTQKALLKTTGHQCPVAQRTARGLVSDRLVGGASESKDMRDPASKRMVPATARKLLLLWKANTICMEEQRYETCI